MAKRPWYPWFPSDYERDTKLLSLEADGLYRRLLDLCWEMGSLPKDLRDLSKISRIDPRKMRRIWPEIEHYFEERNGRLHNNRIDKELRYANEISEKRTEAARLRWNASAEPIASDSPNASAMHPQPQPHIEPRKQGSDPISPERAREDEPRPRSDPDPPDTTNLNREAWKRLSEHLAERHGQQLRPATRHEAITRLLTLDHDTQARAVSDTIASNWPTVYPERYRASAADPPHRPGKLDRAAETLQRMENEFRNANREGDGGDVGATVAQFPKRGRD